MQCKCGGSCTDRKHTVGINGVKFDMLYERCVTCGASGFFRFHDGKDWLLNDEARDAFAEVERLASWGAQKDHKLKHCPI